MRALIVGGAASGKSELAERAALALAETRPVAYIATMLPRGGDAADRIERHRARRDPARFVTVERAHSLGELALPAGCGCVLLECLGNLLANEIYERGQTHGQAVRAIAGDLNRLAEQADHLILVGNDLGADGGCYDDETRAYIKANGELCQAVAYRCELVVEAVCGLALVRRGEELWSRCGG